MENNSLWAQWVKASSVSSELYGNLGRAEMLLSLNIGYYSSVIRVISQPKVKVPHLAFGYGPEGVDFSACQ